MKITTILRGCALFSELDDPALEDLSRVSRVSTCEKGEVIFNDGDDAAALFVVAKGNVELVKSSPDGREQRLRSMEDGEMFAEAAMFSGDSYPATAIARSKAELIVISKNAFVTFVRRHPDVSMKIMGVMARLLRHLNNLLADLKLGSVSSRLAAYLLARARECGGKSFDLGIRKKELALRLGTIPATLSRNLKKLQDDGIVNVRSNQIIIKNIHKLQEIASSLCSSQ